MNSFDHLKFNYFLLIFIENDIKFFKFYEIDRILNKRIIRKKREIITKYLIK